MHRQQSLARAKYFATTCWRCTCPTAAQLWSAVAHNPGKSSNCKRLDFLHSKPCLQFLSSFSWKGGRLCSTRPYSLLQAAHLHIYQLKELTQTIWAKLAAILEGPGA